MHSITVVCAALQILVLIGVLLRNITLVYISCKLCFNTVVIIYVCPQINPSEILLVSQSCLIPLMQLLVSPLKSIRPKYKWCPSRVYSIIGSASTLVWDYWSLSETHFVRNLCCCPRLVHSITRSISIRFWHNLCLTWNQPVRNMIVGLLLCAVSQYTTQCFLKLLASLLTSILPKYYWCHSRVSIRLWN